MGFFCWGSISYRFKGGFVRCFKTLLIEFFCNFFIDNHYSYKYPLCKFFVDIHGDVKLCEKRRLLRMRRKQLFFIFFYPCVR